MLGSSFIIGMLFDGYRVLKGKIEMANGIVFIIDVIFGIISAFFVFYLLLWINHGQLRITMVITFFIGIWIYFNSISYLIIQIWLHFFHVVYYLWRFTIKSVYVLLIKPFILLYKVLSAIIIFISMTIYSILHSIYKFISSIVKHIVMSFKVAGKKIKSKTKEGFLSLLKKILKK